MQDSQQGVELKDKLLVVVAAVVDPVVIAITFVLATVITFVKAQSDGLESAEDRHHDVV